LSLCVPKSAESAEEEVFLPSFVNTEYLIDDFASHPDTSLGTVPAIQLRQMPFPESRAP